VERVPSGDLDALREAIAELATTRVVLDLRHNYGGEVSALQPIADLMADPSVDRPGRLFVLTGRNTYSAASLLVARLDAQTNATIVGEAMAGCPTSYGDPDPIRLPFSGIQVDVSRMLEIGVDAEDHRPTIEPDIPARLTYEAWRAKVDPSLEAVSQAEAGG
jgi:C-terminal processing protease CtpA/Prc